MKSSRSETDRAPLPIGPYSQAVAVGDPRTGAVAGTSIEEQARQTLANLIAILESQGLTTQALVRTTVYLSDMGLFTAFNQVYESMLDGARPARSVVAVADSTEPIMVSGATPWPDCPKTFWSK